MSEEGFTCDYKGWPAWLFILILPFTLTLFCVGVYTLFTGGPYDFGLMGTGIGLAMTLALCHTLLKYSNEKIVVQDEHITWIGWNGKPRVSCSFEELLPNSFVCWSRGGRSDPWRWVRTKDGHTIRWYGSISYDDLLCAVVEKHVGKEE